MAVPTWAQVGQYLYVADSGTTFQVTMRHGTAVEGGFTAASGGEPSLPNNVKMRVGHFYNTDGSGQRRNIPVASNSGGYTALTMSFTGADGSGTYNMSGRTGEKAHKKKAGF